jgi:hypothetical protein
VEFTDRRNNKCKIVSQQRIETISVHVTEGAWDENDELTIAINADLAGIARHEIQMESLFDFDWFVAAEEEREATDDAGNAFVIGLGNGPDAPLNLHNFEL